MKNADSISSQKNLLSLKTTIRTKDYKASKTFYTQVLGLEIVQEYNDGDGSKGSILRFGHEGSNAFFEISEISQDHYYHHESFDMSLANDKIDIQLRTNDIEYWADRLKDKCDTRGPVLRPWGSYYLYLRDPDGLQIIIYEEKIK